MNRRKILIISHNPLTNEDNMGLTLSNLFNQFPKDELCQIYLKNQQPNFDICNNYYYIDEMSIFKSTLFKKKINTGNIVQNSTNSNISNKVNSSYLKKRLSNIISDVGRSRVQCTCIIRNYIWNKKKWFTNRLIDWLNVQKPTCIFYAAGDYTFSMNIALEISRLLNIPIFSYYVDEFYVNKKRKQFIPVEAAMYRKKFKELVRTSSMNFCISEMMKNEYEKIFGKQFDILSNTCQINENICQYKNKKVKKMYYFGNISYERWKCLSELSTAIRKLNEKNDTKIIFEIYSGEKSKKTIDNFLKNKDVIFKGKISQSEVNSKMENADILVHTESFDNNVRKQIKYSVSTKIPNLLASNKVIIAYGPNDVESINYLKRNDAALVINNSDDLESILFRLYSNEDFSLIINNARQLALKNHSTERNKHLLETYIDNYYEV